MSYSLGEILVALHPIVREPLIEHIRTFQARAWEEGYKAGAGAYNESNADPEDFQEEAQEKNPCKPKETQE